MIARAVALGLIAVLHYTAATAQATTVRGRVDRVGGDGHAHPVAQATVTLRNGETGQRTDTSYTGHDGMYYVYGVAPGAYFLEVRVVPQGPLHTFSITARAEPYTDVAPIVVP